MIRFEQWLLVLNCFQTRCAILLTPNQSKQTMATVKEGWLYKRGEFVQNWRPRWFVLKADGTFRGFKGQVSKKSCVVEQGYACAPPIQSACLPNA